MPEPRPLPSFPYGTYDGPPSSASTPRTRSRRLGQALQNTTELAREMARDAFHNALDLDRTRSTLPTPINRRRRRSPSEHGRSDDQGADELSRGQERLKRRRLDMDESPAPRKSIKYGHFGQVEPGKLRLELVSCDGGEHVDPRSPGTYLGVKNLFRHDRSVYCSERKSSNIIMRHTDDMPFCLEELHIVGPEHGFTAPVREGLVYVAMQLKDLLKYLDPPPHARRQGIHTPPYHPQRQDRQSPYSSPERLSLTDALRDPVVNAALDARDQTHLSPADSIYEHLNAADHHIRRDYGYPEAHCDLPPLVGESEDQMFDPDSQAPVTILSDEDEGPEDRTPPEVLEFRLQRVRLMRRRLEAENYDREDRLHGLQGLHFEASDRDRQHFRSMPGGLRRYTARVPPPPPEEQVLPSVFGRTPGVEANFQSDAHVRCTRFHFKKDKHKVAIRFEPGLSGRFILLKMWSFEHCGNVDVQSVIAKGFGGCRFFPSREPR